MQTCKSTHIYNFAQWYAYTHTHTHAHAHTHAHKYTHIHMQAISGMTAGSDALEQHWSSSDNSINDPHALPAAQISGPLSLPQVLHFQTLMLFLLLLVISLLIMMILPFFRVVQFGVWAHFKVRKLARIFPNIFWGGVQTSRVLL